MDTEAPLPESAPVIKPRRRYPRAFKEQILTECGEPGASIAGVAIRHGLNPNMVHKWRRDRQPRSQDDFVQLPAPVSAPAVETPTTVRMEVPTRKGTLVVHWPISELQTSVTWLRALTR